MRYRAGNNHALVLGKVRYVESVIRKDALGKDVPAERIRIDILDVEWITRMSGWFGDVRSGKTIWATNMPAAGAADCPAIGAVGLGETYWFVLVGGDPIWVLAAAEAR